MAKKATCRCKQAECEECPEWIFTFADLVMLMMGFFVILWVLKPNPNPKGGGADEEMIKLQAAIRDAFGYVPNPKSTDPVDMRMLLDKSNAPRIPDGPGAGGETRIKRQGADGTDPEVTTIRLGKQSVVGGRMDFDRGEAKLLPDCITALDQIATQIRGHRNVVLVKGHTSLDDFGDATATPAQNMDISLRRAQAVADYLASKGVAPDILRVEGCSTFEPVIQRQYTPASQGMNRRVEVEVTPTLVADLQSSPGPASAPAELIASPGAK
jgi:outer membrane protein OmpA-like peptidoglycan-associated protein